VTEVRSERVAEVLGLDEAYDNLLQTLDAAGPPAEPLDPLSDGELRARLRSVWCSEETIADAVATWPDPGKDPERWWLLERARHYLTSVLGDIDAYGGSWPQLPDPLGPPGRCFYLHVYAATLPATRAWHQSRGIPDDVSWATLRDVSRHEAIHRRIYGTTGIDSPGWMMIHLRGAIFELGRLQFAPFHFRPEADWPDATVAAALGEGFRPGDAALDVHIPAGDRLDFQACEDSYRKAKSFFDEYFPSPVRRVATCTSWLLDDQLAEFLPETSNIIRFQRGFTLVPGGRDADEGVRRFVFLNRGNTAPDPTPRTLLERGVLAHFAAGRHFFWRTGWRDLVPE